MVYTDRVSAGRALGAELQHLRAANPLVLGLPRGGVPVAAAVHETIGGELDIMLVRKLGVPWQPELAAGAIGEDGAQVVNSEVLRSAGVTAERLAESAHTEHVELVRRRKLWCGNRAPIPLADRTVIIVDDGMATGATVAVACRVARSRQPRHLVVAVPVSAPDALRRVWAEADELVCPLVPDTLGGVGNAYQDFHQLDDREVAWLLGT